MGDTLWHVASSQGLAHCRLQEEEEEEEEEEREGRKEAR